MSQIMYTEYIRPGAYFYILGGQGSLRVTKRVSKFCFGAIYKGRLWEKELGVSVQYVNGSTVADTDCRVCVHEL